MKHVREFSNLVKEMSGNSQRILFLLVCGNPAIVKKTDSVDALSRKKGVSCKFSITNISFSVCQNLMELHSYIVYLKYYHVPFVLYLCQTIGKGCLMSFTLGYVLVFFDSQSKHFPISLRQFKIYVADLKPQTINSFFPIFN